MNPIGMLIILTLFLNNLALVSSLEVSHQSLEVGPWNLLKEPGSLLLEAS